MVSNGKTRSTGKPARSRKQRLSPPTTEFLDPTTERPEGPPVQYLQDSSEYDQGPALQVRPEPPVPTEGEQEILDLLWHEYDRSDDVAKAAARFESDVHEQLVQRRVQDGLSEDEAGEIRRVFRADEFNDTYRRLLMLRMERELLRNLDLQDYEHDIMQARIQVVFGPKPTGTKKITFQQDQRVQDQQVHVGDPETQQVQDLKRRGRQRKRR